MLSSVASAGVVPQTPDTVDFPSALRAFDAHMAAIGLAPRTRHAYRRELTNFWCDWCLERDLDVIQASRDELNLYLRDMKPNGSQRGDASRALKSFYAYLEGTHRSDNPARLLKIPRPKLEPAPHLPKPDARALVRAAFHREARRGWAILLALNTGARVGSLVAIRFTDVDLAGQRIRFAKAKGGRTYGVPLNFTASHAALRLMQLGHDPLLGVGEARFRQWVHQAEYDAGLGRVWPHLLRHEFSNRVAAAGDPEAWRRAMGHADLSQWPRYVHADEERLRSALRKV